MFADDIDLARKLRAIRDYGPEQDAIALICPRPDPPRQERGAAHWAPAHEPPRRDRNRRALFWPFPSSWSRSGSTACRSGRGRRRCHSSLYAAIASTGAPWPRSTPLHQIQDFDPDEMAGEENAEYDAANLAESDTLEAVGRTLPTTREGAIEAADYVGADSRGAPIALYLITLIKAMFQRASPTSTRPGQPDRTVAGHGAEWSSGRRPPPRLRPRETPRPDVRRGVFRLGVAHGLGCTTKPGS